MENNVLILVHKAALSPTLNVKHVTVNAVHVNFHLSTAPVVKLVSSLISECVLLAVPQTSIFMEVLAIIARITATNVSEKQTIVLNVQQVSSFLQVNAYILVPKTSTTILLLDSA